MKKAMWLCSLLWLGCVGDDGTEVIGSYAPPGDATSGQEEEEDQGESERLENSVDVPPSVDAAEDTTVESSDAIAAEDTVVPDEEDAASEDAENSEEPAPDAMVEEDVTVEIEDGEAAEDTSMTDVSDEVDVDAQASDIDEGSGEDTETQENTEDIDDDTVVAFGEACESNSDCDAALCLEIETGKICTTYCDDVECPEGYGCDTYGGGVVPFCQPLNE